MTDARTPRQNRRDSDPVVVPIRRGGISQARRYTPRGRTVRESGSDPCRPSLRVVPGEKDRDAGENPGSTADASRTRGDRSGAAAGTAQGTSGAVGGRRSSGGRQAAAARTTSRRPTPRRERSGATRGTAAANAARTRGSTSKRATGTRRAVPPRRRRTGRLGNPMRRLRFGTVVVVALFLVIAGRLVELQLTDAPAYAAHGLEQRLREVPLPAPRGAILDRTGAALAHSVESRYVYADPEMVEDPDAAAGKLSPVLGIAKSTLRIKMRRSVRENGRPVRFAYLARGVSVSVGDRVTALNLAGVRVQRDERREVPGHDLAANVIGFTGREGQGLAGLEAAYESVLRGTDGERVDEIGMNGVPIPDGYHHEEPARPGRSIQLTIDRDLQYETQRILAATMEQARATFGSALVLDARTGEIVAMASWPSYDAANAFDVADEKRLDYNTAAMVEPGSVHKPLVLGAALEEGIIEPDSTPVVPSTIRKGGTTFRDTHWHDTRKMTLAGILAHSSNVGTIQVADQLGASQLYDYQRKLGLGTSTECGLPGELDGLVQPPNRWSGSSYGSVPIGLGVAVTPVQIAAAYAAIANDGVWRQPRLVRGTSGKDGDLDAAKPGEEHRVFSKGTARELRRAMEAVTTVSGATGRQAAIPGYRVAGKTGTGLRVKDNRYQYGDVTSFVGMVPADEPRFVVGVFAHVPKGAGGGVAAPVFRNVMTATLQHYAVPPTGRKAPRLKVYA